MLINKNIYCTFIVYYVQDIAQIDCNKFSTARSTYVRSAVLIWYVVCLSVVRL